MVKVTIKWKKETYSDVELDVDDSVLSFRALIYSLTGVPPERQKIMDPKAGMLKDDADLSKLNIKPGHVFMLIGTADELKAPEARPVFIEDVVSSDVASASQLFPPGLANLGNTCYMNSTLQVLRRVPELSTALQSFDSPNPDADTRLTLNLRELYRQLGSQHNAVAPYMFLQELRNTYPQFAENEDGRYMQQDAEECFTQLLSSLRNKLVMGGQNVIDDLFGVEFDVEYGCEHPDALQEPHSFVQERNMKLRCNVSPEAGSLMHGLKLAMVEEVEKNSPTLGGALAPYRKVSTIRRLPPFLTIQFMRFAWRQDTQKRAKVLRSVKFPFKLDVFDLCSDELKETLSVSRHAAEAVAEYEIKHRAKNVGSRRGGASGSGASSSSAPPPVVAAASAAAAADSDAMQVDGEVSTAPPEPVNAPCGWYELCGIITHQGRTADSGHYVGWVKQDNGEWLKFDDDKVSPVTEEKVQELSGGGDWHMAYVMLYRDHTPDGKFVLPS